MTVKKPSDKGGTQAYIYALKHPITNEIRYIGKANNPSKRLKSHLLDSKRRNTPVYCWIRSLANEGMLPLMDILELSDNWENSEKQYIAHYRLNGNLLNIAAGGNEPTCPAKVLSSNGYANSKKRDPLLWSASRKLGQLLHEAKRKGYKSVDKLEQLVFMFAAANASQRIKMAKVITRGDV